MSNAIINTRHEHLFRLIAHISYMALFLDHCNEFLSFARYTT